MQYKILSNTNKKEFEQEVEKLIRDGWVLNGGVSVAANDDWEYYSQALIKQE